MGLRDRRQDRREERREERAAFGVGGNAERYQLRQKLVSIGDDYWIEDGEGQRRFKVDGKALRVRKTLDIANLDGETLLHIQARVLNIRDTMEIEGPDGSSVAKVHKAMITPLRERFKVDRADGGQWDVQGNIVDHEYEIEDDGRKIAEVSKKWFRVRDTYGVEIAPGADVPLVLAVTVAIDSMAHPRD